MIAEQAVQALRPQRAVEDGRQRQVELASGSHRFGRIATWVVDRGAAARVAAEDGQIGSTPHRHLVSEGVAGAYLLAGATDARMAASLDVEAPARRALGSG